MSLFFFGLRKGLRFLLVGTRIPVQQHILITKSSYHHNNHIKPSTSASGVLCGSCYYEYFSKRTVECVKMTHSSIEVYSNLTVKETTCFYGTLRFILSFVEACFSFLLLTSWIQSLFLQDLLQYWLCSYRLRLVFCFFPLDFSQTNARSFHCTRLTAIAIRAPFLTILTEE